MALLRSVFCCFPRAQPSSTTTTPEMTQTTLPPRPVPLPLYQNRAADGWSQGQSQINTPGRAVIHGSHGGYDGSGGDGDDGYTPVIPLPRYTPRPLSIREKTVDAQTSPSSPSPSSRRRSGSGSGSGFWMDEKQRYDHEPDQDRDGVTADDVSSSFSFQSSYGNTSTATRETPPPPYSPMSSRPTSLSISSGSRPQPQPQQVLIAQPPPVWSSRGSVEETERPRISADSREWRWPLDK